MPPKSAPRTRPAPRPRQTPTSSILPPPAIITPPTTITAGPTIITPPTTITAGPTIITPPKLPNTSTPRTPRTPRVRPPAINKPTYNRVRNPAPRGSRQPNSIVIPTTTPYSNSPNITSSNLPNTDSTTANQDNTLTYVILGALVVGIIILKNKDI